MRHCGKKHSSQNVFRLFLHNYCHVYKFQPKVSTVLFRLHFLCLTLLLNSSLQNVSLTNFFGRVSFVRLENPLCLPILSATVPGPHDVVGGEDNCQCCGWWDGARGALHVP